MKLITVIRNIMEELSNKGTFDSLTNYIANEKSLEKENRDLIVEYVKNQKLFDLLESKLMQCKASHERLIQRYEAQAYYLENKSHVK